MKIPTIGLIIIGDEILSGRTLDKNTQHIAKTIGMLGIDLKEVAVISDDEEKIISKVREFSKAYSYVFTTGGIGPTHDDITSLSVAKAFNQEYVLNQTAYNLLEGYYGKDKLNDGRIKMAYVPENARLIENKVTIAPGFAVENVFVMAGVPNIMQAMLEAIIPQLEVGVVNISKTVEVHCGESQISEMLGNVQNEFKEVAIGSYPFTRENYKVVGTNIVLRSRNSGKLDEAMNVLIENLQREAVNFSLENKNDD